MPNIEKLKKYKKIHMIGIGGVSMSGIAEILINFGFQVTGSNNVESDATKKLEKSGIKVFIGHNAQNITDPDVVVYSAAIKQDNIEIVTAKEKNIHKMFSRYYYNCRNSRKKYNYIYGLFMFFRSLKRPKYSSRR